MLPNLDWKRCCVTSVAGMTLVGLRWCHCESDSSQLGIRVLEVFELDPRRFRFLVATASESRAKSSCSARAAAACSSSAHPRVECQTRIRLP